ncbi:MAG: HlyC/CorC family transporter, partial [Lachnospiraceae bacterium]|nr:HlyC/CorC family transporter [Lachnospiraceae bacterium]
MDPATVLQLITLLILLFFSAFFSSAETSLTAVNKIRIRKLADDGDKRAAMVLKLHDNQERMLSAILIGNNIVNLSASALTTTLSLTAFKSISVGVATGIITALILIFGEITPKSISTLRAEKMSLAYSRIIYVLMIILTPVSFVLNKISRFFMWMVGINPDDKAVITEDELLTYVDVSHEEGVIEKEEREMINNVVDFGDSYAKDVMVPRIDMAFAEDTMSYDEVMAIFRKEQYSRLPVFHETRDNIIGILYLKDFIFFTDDPANFVISEHVREAYFSFEYKKTSELMAEMRRNSISLAIILDEYGAVAGLVSMEDLLEEIVGEIRDEYDQDEKDDIRNLSEDEFLIDGLTRTEDINERFGLDLDTSDHDSIAGFVLDRLGHIPIAGEHIADGDVSVTVVAMDKKRISEIRIKFNKKNEN